MKHFKRLVMHYITPILSPTYDPSEFAYRATEDAISSEPRSPSIQHLIPSSLSGCWKKLGPLGFSTPSVSLPSVWVLLRAKFWTPCCSTWWHMTAPPALPQTTSKFADNTIVVGQGQWQHGSADGLVRRERPHLESSLLMFGRSSPAQPGVWMWSTTTTFWGYHKHLLLGPHVLMLF